MDTPLSQAVDFFQDCSARSKSMSRSFGNHVLNVLCIFLALLTLIPLISLVYLVVSKGWPLFTWESLTGLPPAAGRVGGGFGNAIVGTAVMVFLALALAVPLGVLSAVYLTEYAQFHIFSHAVRFVAKLLTGIPSIIAGVFAFAIIVLPLGKFSALAGAVALAVLILPIILLTAEQAFLGVRKDYREASFGLGATAFQTIWHIVLPEALPTLASGILLAIARAAGETAPVLFTALFSQYWMHSLLEPTASLSTLIYNFSTLPYDYQMQLAWTASLVLVILVTLTNLIAQRAFRKAF